MAVRAAGLNRAELLQIAGHYPPPPGASEVLGLELAGEVAEVGLGVGAWKLGARAMAIVAGGAFADYALVSADHLMPVPPQMTWEQAAALPEAFLTAYSNLLEVGNLTAGEGLLIHAAASGVGLAALQIARTIRAHPVGTASAAKHALCLAQGAERMLDYKTEDFAEALLAEGRKIHCILDMVGGPYWGDNLRLLEKWGRLVIIGLMGGREVQADLGLLMRKRLHITGTTLRDRTDAEKAALTARFWHWAGPLFQTGDLSPVVWRTYPLEQVGEGLAAMRANENAGKIVLRV
jgi:putative PIG3 family NAD(P)H quinone oxidoreductase